MVLVISPDEEADVVSTCYSRLTLTILKNENLGANIKTISAYRLMQFRCRAVKIVFVKIENCSQNAVLYLGAVK